MAFLSPKKWGKALWVGMKISPSEQPNVSLSPLPSCAIGSRPKKDWELYRRVKRRSLRAVSKRLRILQKEYAAIRQRFLSEHPKCAVYPRRLATEVHHSRGRAGTLLLDKRFFRGVSRAGHDWINAHPARARALGLLADEGHWNHPPGDDETQRLRGLMAELL